MVAETTSGQFVLLEYHPAPDHVYGKHLKRPIREEARRYMSPQFYLNDEPLHSLVSQREYKVRVEKDVPERLTVQVERVGGTTPSDRQQVLMKSARFVVDRSRGGSLSSGEFTRTQGPQAVVTSITNDLAQYKSSFWYQQSRTIESFVLNSKERQPLRSAISTWTYDFDTPLPARRFMLSAFNLPEPVDLETPDIATRRPIVLTLVAVVLALMAVGIGYVLRQRRKRGT